MTGVYVGLVVALVFLAGVLVGFGDGFPAYLLLLMAATLVGELASQIAVRR